MLDAVTMHYLNSRVWAAIGATLTIPSTIFAVIEGERVTLFFAVATGILAFLWAIRKYPVEQLVEDAKKALAENHTLREQNTKYAEENERLRIRQANIEESGIRKKPEIPD